MNIKVFLKILFCIFFCFRYANAQDPFKPKSLVFTPATPNAAALGKFGEYPVDFSSGLVDITIPLYEIKSSKITLPISLRYHASGIKVGDQASCVGLGWSLQAGGMISRSVKDKIDDFNGYLKSTNVIRPASEPMDPDHVLVDYNYIKSFIQPGVSISDGQPDIFSYNLINKSGQFFFDRDKVNTITIPYDKVLISYTPNLASFTIVDTDGTIYVYGKSLDGSTDYKETSYVPTGIGDNQQSTNTGWMLTTIISSDKTDTIRFTYTADPVEYDFGITDQVEKWDDHHGSGTSLATGKLGLHEPTSNISHFNGSQLNLEQITFKNGKVVFEKDARSDGSMGKKIKRISVYRLDALNLTYSKIKSIDFTYDYFGTSYKRLKLNQVSLNDLSDIPVQNYTFSYNTIAVVPAALTRGIDYWGYYNGASNQTLIPNTVLNDGASGPLSAGNCNREPDLFYAQTCMLTSIIFPTGGRTDFEYELNRYKELNGPDKNAGGLRIKQIASYDRAEAAPVIKTYKYGENENGIGKLITPIDYFGFFTTEYTLKHIDVTAITNPEDVHITNYNSSPLNGLTGMDGRIVYYDYVTEYNGTPASNIGKTVYRFNYQGDTYMQYGPFKGSYFRQNYSWKRGHLLQKTMYSASGALVYTQINSYGQIKQQWYDDVGYIVNQNFNVTNNSSIGGTCGGCTPDAFAGMYSYHVFSVETGNYKLINSTEINYNQQDDTKTQNVQTSYQYDLSIYEPFVVTKTTIEGSDVYYYKYPLNYNTNVTTSDAFINGIKNLKNINDLTRVVETYKRKLKPDNTLIGTTEGVLTQFKSNAPYPEVIYKLERTAPITNFSASSTSGASFTMDTRYKAELQFSSYLNGNLMQQQKVNDLIKSYIWDYNNALVIAEVSNGSSSDIAYTSFETNGTGNWSGINLNNIYSTPQPVTGSRVYNLAGTTLVKPGLNSSTTYIISYWSNSGVYSVSGTSATGWPKNTKSVMLSGTTWNLWEHKVSNVSSLSVSGTGYIDELRLYPASAQMVTYTYTPLIGLKSVCDVNNMISYYDYDSFGRLKLIKDFKGNILKTYAYKYQTATP